LVFASSLCLFAGTAFRSKDTEPRLYVLKDGREFFGTPVLSTSRDVFIKVEGRIRHCLRSQIARIVERSQLPAELEKRLKRAKGDTAKLLKLAAWCRQVELIGEARKLLTQVLTLDPGNKEAQAQFDLLRKLDPTLVPWKKDELVIARLEVVKFRSGRWIPEPRLRRRLAVLLADAPSFVVLPQDDKTGKPSYVLRCELRAKLVRRNTFYGNVPVSETYSGEAVLFVLDPKTKRKLFVLGPFRTEDTYPVQAKTAESEILQRAFNQLAASIKKHPDFRLAGKARRAVKVRSGGSSLKGRRTSKFQ